MDEPITQCGSNDVEIPFGLTGFTDPTREFEATSLALVLMAPRGEQFSESLRHQWSAAASSSGAGLDEIGTGHHADKAGFCDIALRPQFSRAENRFQMGFATGFTKTSIFVLKGLRVSG